MASGRARCLKGGMFGGVVYGGDVMDVKADAIYSSGSEVVMMMGIR